MRCGNTKSHESWDLLVQDRLINNPLLLGIINAIRRVEAFKSLVRDFYFEVLLSVHACPRCGGRLRMASQSQCTCKCGLVLDPTLEFQRSHCCDARLIRRVCHYTCSTCGQVIPSKFLFDERLFDTEYFRQKMAESRGNRQKKREEVRLLLAASRSKPLMLDNSCELDSVPGLVMALDEFIGHAQSTPFQYFNPKSEFCMEEYRDTILAAIQDCNRYFSAIQPLYSDQRRDRIWRFMTLIFMDHEGEVDLVQRDNDILVMRHEADREGQAVY